MNASSLTNTSPAALATAEESNPHHNNVVTQLRNKMRSGIKDARGRFLGLLDSIIGAKIPKSHEAILAAIATVADYFNKKKKLTRAEKNLVSGASDWVKAQERIAKAVKTGQTEGVQAHVGANGHTRTGEAAIVALLFGQTSDMTLDIPDGAEKLERTALYLLSGDGEGIDLMTLGFERSEIEGFRKDVAQAGTAYQVTGEAWYQALTGFLDTTLEVMSAGDESEQAAAPGASVPTAGSATGTVGHSAS